MEYEERYRGQRMAVITTRLPDGSWKARAELLTAGGQRVPVEEPDGRYPSEEQAKRAAISLAAGAVDRGRISKGKP